MFQLPPLPYAYNAIEPTISAQTMRLHHDVHHARYVEVCNQLAPSVIVPYLGPRSFDLGVVAAWIRDGHLPPTEEGKKFRNNFGQHLNHSLFWQMLRPKTMGITPASPEILRAAAISNDEFPDINSVLDKALSVGTSLFGSGWVWIGLTGPTLRVQPFEDGDNPLFHGMKPLLGIDVWEHAYYLDYGPDRHTYLSQVMAHSINWNEVNQRALRNGWM